MLEPLKHRNDPFMLVCVAGKLQRGRSALGSVHCTHPQGRMGKAGGVHTSGVMGLGEAEGGGSCACGAVLREGCGVGVLVLLLSSQHGFTCCVHPIKMHC